MASLTPSLYQCKKALMLPWKLYRRRRDRLEPGFLRSAMELHYYRPTFYRWLTAVSANPGLLHQAPIGADSLVLDVGAYTGEWAEEVAAAYDPRIICLEPDPRNFKLLEKRAAANPKLTAHAYGVGDRTERVQMSLEFLGSSIYGEASAETASAEVQILDILEAWRELALDEVDLMKINIEGSEFPLLERMIEVDLLRRVRCFLIQFHEWHPGAYGRRRRIRRALSASHELEWDYPFIWEKWVLR